MGLHLAQIFMITVKGTMARYCPSLLRSSVMKKSNKSSKKSKLTSPLKMNHINPNPKHPPGGKISERKLKLSSLRAKPKALIREAIDQGHPGGGSRTEGMCSKGWKRGYSIGSEANKRVSPFTRKIPDDNLTTIIEEGRKAITRHSAPMTPGDIIAMGDHPGGWMTYQKETIVVTEVEDPDRGSRDPYSMMATWRSHGCAEILTCSLTASATSKCQGGLAYRLRSRCTTERKIRRTTSRFSNPRLRSNAGQSQYGVTCLTPRSLGPPEYGSTIFPQKL